MVALQDKMGLMLDARCWMLDALVMVAGGFRAKWEMALRCDALHCTALHCTASALSIVTLNYTMRTLGDLNCVVHQQAHHHCQFHSHSHSIGRASHDPTRGKSLNIEMG
jgi:hypothetical protein